MYFLQNPIKNYKWTEFNFTYISVTLVRLLIFEGTDPLNEFQSNRLISHKVKE